MRFLIEKIKSCYFVLKKEGLHSMIISFLLTLMFITIGGFIFNWYFQNRLDQRQRDYEFFRFQLEKKDYTINLLSKNINLRYLNSIRVITSINSQDVWSDYYDSVTQWNINLEEIRTNIVKYYGWELASKLIDSTNDSISANPKTLHYKFVKLHEYIIAKKNGDFSKSEQIKKLEEEIIKQKNEIITYMIEDLKTGNELLKK